MPIAASSEYFFLNLHLFWAAFSRIDCGHCILYNNILENFISHFCRYPVFLALGAPGVFCLVIRTANFRLDYYRFCYCLSSGDHFSNTLMEFLPV